MGRWHTMALVPFSDQRADTLKLQGESLMTGGIQRHKAWENHDLRSQGCDFDPSKFAPLPSPSRVAQWHNSASRSAISCHRF